MSGVRTRSGCWTCRIRKKKCDEQKPSCINCRARSIHCYGYGVRPDWMLELGSWKEILESKEAKLIRESAETTYKQRRRDWSIKNIQKIDQEMPTAFEDGRLELLMPNEESSPTSVMTEGIINNTLSTVQHEIKSTIPRSLNSLPTLPATHLSQRSDLKLLMTFLDVIFPLQFGFYGLSKTTDRSWLLHTLLDTEPLYQASLGVSLSYEAGLRRNFSYGDTDFSSDARILQLNALKGLQLYVDDLSTEKYHGDALLRKGMQTLATMNQLLSLEVFSFLEGQWKPHLDAARTILGMFQKQWAPELFGQNKVVLGSTGIEEISVNTWSTDDLKALNFFITSFVWCDILANATLGPPKYNPKDFDYIPLLKNGNIKLHEMMGCQSHIMTSIAEITELEGWKNIQMDQSWPSVVELVAKADKLESRLTFAIQGLECTLCIGFSNLQADSEAVNLIFAYTALVYLKTVVLGPLPEMQGIKDNVTRCLERLEALPSRLLIRVCWPFTIAACMATEDQYERFRYVVARTVADKQALGTIWKGVKVMEECWRLRQDSMGLWEWRSTMGAMNINILLI